MAIAFARVSIHTRSKGHSAVAASSYRSATKLLDSRIGSIHDYSQRHAVVYTTLLLPEGANTTFADREFLWNQAELAEKRRDAQVCKDVVLALPKELPLAQQIELTERFAKMHFVDNGLPADIAIHDHGDDNPHAHILIPTRRLEHDRFSLYKARDLNPVFAKGRIVEADFWGEQWRTLQNDFFAEKQIDLTVDFNHLIPECHQGRNNAATPRYLREENHLRQQDRAALVRDNIENVIAHLAEQHSVFTRRDVERLLFKTFKNSDHPQEYLQWVEQVLSHGTIMHLGANDTGKACYTTRQQYINEAKLRHAIEKMMRRYRPHLPKAEETLHQKYTLNEEQKAAFEYVTQGSDISVVIGRPGTGKSYLLKPINEYFTQNKYVVIGAALSGKVVKALQAETGITSSTIASLAYRLTHNRLRLTKQHILVIDEAGMVDFNNMAVLIHKARKAGSKVILVGDPDQLKPIQKGEIFRGIASITGFIELENIQRQEEPGDRQASMDFAKGNIDAAIQHYMDKGAVTFSDTKDIAIETLIHDWRQDIAADDLKDTVLLAFTRSAVDELNQKARAVLKDRGVFGSEEIVFHATEKVFPIAHGERLLFRQNDKDIGVRNGDLGTVKAVHATRLDVLLDTGESVTVPKTYQSLDYGYALTVHKSQGMTVKHAKVLIDSRYWDRHLSFVALTRHKQSVHIYADKINHPDRHALMRTLKRSVTRDNVIDWPLDYATRAGFNPDKLVGKVVNHLAGVGHKIKNGFNYIAHYEGYLRNKQQKRQYQDNTAFRRTARQIAHYLDQEQECSKQSRQLTETAKSQHVTVTKLSGYKELEQQAKICNKAAHDLCSSSDKKRDIPAFDYLDSHKIMARAEQYEQLQSQERFAALKTQHPMLERYDKLLHEYNRQSGYYREKIDAELQMLTKDILSNKQLVGEMKKIAPAVLERLSKKIQHPSLIQDR